MLPAALPTIKAEIPCCGGGFSEQHNSAEKPSPKLRSSAAAPRIRN